MRGNVVLACIAGGAACVIEVQADGSATYARTGGVPVAVAALCNVDAARQPRHCPPARYTVPTGASEMRGNVVLTCPAAGAACVIEVQADGSATYALTGGVPVAVAALCNVDAARQPRYCRRHGTRSRPGASGGTRQRRRGVSGERRRLPYRGAGRRLGNLRPHRRRACDRPFHAPATTGASRAAYPRRGPGPDC